MIQGPHLSQIEEPHVTHEHDHTHTARDVVLAALVVTPPDVEKPIEWKADLIVAALIEHGHLPAPDRPVTTEDYERAAKHLASLSRHPRYTGSGWTRLIESEADVEVAFAQAQKRGNGGADVQALRDLLLDLHRAPSAAL